MKAYKTPLRYPGGKSVQKLFGFVPENKYNELREPFIGGGSFAIEWKKDILAQKYGLMICMNLCKFLAATAEEWY